MQSGDANTFIGLWSRESASEAEKMGSQLQPQPDVHYTSSKVFVQGDEAALLGKYGKDEFLSVRFVKEGGRWKIKDFTFSDKAYPAESVYAMVPPAAGAFERAGAPWQNVAPTLDQADAAKHGFQVRATYDESFLYIRIESPTPLPTPGSQAEKPPTGWPVMKVNVSGVGEFVLHATANIGDQATFDQSGLFTWQTTVAVSLHGIFVRHSVREWHMTESGIVAIGREYSTMAVAARFL